MSRFQMSLNVADANRAAEFYTKLLGVGPVKQRDGYANFVVEDPPMKLIVIENEGVPGTINHVGIEYADGEAVAAETERVAEAGLDVLVDDPHTCCFATQEKAWTRDVDGVPWELYTVVEDTSNFGANPHGGTPVDQILPPADVSQVIEALNDPRTLVIDAQGDGGFEIARIPGALNFSLEDPASQAAAVTTDKDQSIVLYCTDEGCLGSEFIGTQLVESGFTNVRRFAGGVKEWADAGLPVDSDG